MIDDRTGAKVCDAKMTIRDSNGEMEDLDGCCHAASVEDASLKGAGEVGLRDVAKGATQV